MDQRPDNLGQAIAVIGMAGRFPGARSLDELWQNLCSGKEAIDRFTQEQLLSSGNDPALIKDPRYVAAGTTLEDAECFDAEFFGYVPREAAFMDPQHRLFLQCAWEALEDAGYDPSACPGSVGIFGGCSLNSYWLRNLCTNPETRPFATDFSTMLGNDKDFLTVRVAYKLNFKGPAMTVQTACSTSLVAVVQACQSLLNFQCDVALAGGVAVHAPQVEGYLFREGMILSPDGHCRAFDAQAQGTVPGAGVGLVVLKRFAEALESGDRILAVIRGAATNNDGGNKVGFTAPSVAGQAECIATAQAQAEVSPETISYIEAHGTGTPLGDPIEIEALTLAFRARTVKNQFCAIGSIKPNIGHADAAAGIAGLIKLVLALKHKKLPPSLFFEHPNPKIDFAGTPFFVNTQLVDWKPGTTPRRGGVSSFGIGGTNAHCVLEEAPVPQASGPSRSLQLLVWSARNEQGLDEATSNLVAQFRRPMEIALADTAFTLQSGRKAFSHRCSLVCGSVEEARSILEGGDARRWNRGKASDENLPVVFLFPGQGCEFVHMGEELYRTEAVFRSEVDRCAEHLLPLIGSDLRLAMYPNAAEETKARESIHEARIAQLAIFTVEYALAKLWMSWGVHPAALLGHSIGEYVAATLSGVFSLEESLRLLAVRARLMQDSPIGAMLAVKMPAQEIEPLLSGLPLSLAAVNSSTLSVISGPPQAVEDFKKLLSGRQVATKRLPASHAFHSPMMDPILGPFAEQVRRTDRKAPKIPIMSTYTAKWFTAVEAQDASYWSNQMRHTVRFADALQSLLAQHDGVLLEVGPGQTLTQFVRQHPAKKPDQQVLGCFHPMQESNRDLEAMLAAAGKLWVAGIDLDWKAFSANESRHRVALPTYPFQRMRHWIEPGLNMAASPTESSTPGTRPIRVGDPDGNELPEVLMERVMAQQMEVMQQQLDVLKGHGGL